MANALLSEGSTTKVKEAGNFAFLLTDVVIPDGMSRGRGTPKNGRLIYFGAGGA